MSSILHALLISGGHFALLECRPLLDARRGDGQRHNDGRQELQALDGHDLRVEYDGVDEAINDRAENRGDDALLTLLRPSSVSPMMRQARPMTTMPVPELMSTVF